MEAKVTRKQLLKILKEINEIADTEEGHIKADRALIDFINDAEIAEAFEKINKWYA